VLLTDYLHLLFKQALVTSKLELHIRKKPVNCHTSRIAVSCAETGILRKVDMMYLNSFEMWCWRKMEKISWTDRVRNEEVLHREKEEGNVLHTVKRRKANWIGHILCGN